MAIPQSLTSMGEMVFGYCTSLTRITIANSVTSIAPRAFYCCTSVTTVTIPDSVTKIRDSAFSGCSSLTSVTISRSVTSIEYEAFARCSSLIGVYFLGSAPAVDSSAFSGDPATVYYLPGTMGWGPTFGGLPTMLWSQTRGDVDKDGDVDRNDLLILLAARNTPASGPDDPRDLDGDGKITVLDARILATLFTRPGGAVR
jgi:hypothetical protein